MRFYHELLAPCDADVHVGCSGLYQGSGFDGSWMEWICTCCCHKEPLDEPGTSPTETMPTGEKKGTGERF